jgi:hypothetical protein
MAAAPGQTGVEGTWSVGRYTFYIGGSAHLDFFGVTIKLAGNERIDFRLRTYEEKIGDKGWPQDVIDKRKLLQILTTMLQFPFRSEEDFTVLDGPSGVYEGVRVFSGNIRSAYRDSRKYYEDGAKESNLAWYDEATVFVTDSDPQYVCLTIDLREER